MKKVPVASLTATRCRYSTREFARRSKDVSHETSISTCSTPAGRASSALTLRRATSRRSAFAPTSAARRRLSLTPRARPHPDAALPPRTRWQRPGCDRAGEWTSTRSDGDGRRCDGACRQDKHRRAPQPRAKLRAHRGPRAEHLGTSRARPPRAKLGCRRPRCQPRLGTDRVRACPLRPAVPTLGSRSEAHTSELQSLMPISYAVFCLKQKNRKKKNNTKITS